MKTLKYFNQNGLGIENAESQMWVYLFYYILYKERIWTEGLIMYATLSHNKYNAALKNHSIMICPKGFYYVNVIGNTVLDLELK